MVNTFVLLPLYIYPNPGVWDPLFSAANAHPDLTFQVIVNPEDGPGGSSCPDSNFVSVMNQINSTPNIKTLGYVHTAEQYNCGSSGTDICPCTRPLSQLEANITIYQHWASADCSSGEDIHIDGIFMDEAPETASCEDYMRNATDFAKSTLTNGNTVLFNPGTATDSVYFSIADYINIIENTGSAFASLDVSDYDGNGQYAQQSTIILYSFSDDTSTLNNTVTTILSGQDDAIAGLMITDQDGYTSWGNDWDQFVAAVDKVAAANGAE